MAKVILPLGSQAARGKVSSWIYNTWRGLNTVKSFAVPTNPQSTRQLLTRGYLTTLSRAWAGLTAGQRADWATWAAENPVTDWTGNSYAMTGLNAYLKLNSVVLDMGASAVATPPAAAGPGAIVAFAASDASGTTVVTWTSPGGTATKTDIWLYRMNSAGCTPTLVKARHNSYTTAETATKTISSLSAGTYAVYGRHVNETTGQVGSWSLDLATVS